MLLNRISDLFKIVRAWSKARPREHYVQVFPTYEPTRVDCGLIYAKYNENKSVVALHKEIAAWIERVRKDLSTHNMEKHLREGPPVPAIELLALPSMFNPKKVVTPSTKPGRSEKACSGDAKGEGQKSFSERRQDAKRAELQAVLDQSECKCASKRLIKFTSPTQKRSELPSAIGKLLRSNNVKMPKVNDKNICLPWIMEGGCPMKYIQKKGRTDYEIVTCGPCAKETRVHLTEFTKPKLQPLWDFLQNSLVKSLLLATDEFERSCPETRIPPRVAPPHGASATVAASNHRSNRSSPRQRSRRTIMTTRKDLSRTSPTPFPPIHLTLNLEEWKPRTSRH